MQMLRKFIWVSAICLLLCFLPLNATGNGLGFVAPAYAASWLDLEDSSIYDSGSDINDLEESGGVGQEYDSLYIKEKRTLVDSLGDLLAGGITALADSIYDMFSKMGITLNSIIYSRVGGASDGTNGISLTSFELVPGNVYGFIGGSIYQIFAGVVLLIAICAFSFRMAQYLISPTGGNKAGVKEFLGYGPALVALVILMPFLLYIGLYIRDTILYIAAISGGNCVSAIRNALGTDNYNGVVASGIGYTQAIFGSKSPYNMVYQLGISANSGNLLNAILYFGSVLLMLMYMLLYISQALSMLILYVLFPFVCVMGIFQKQLLSEWLKNVISIMILPIIDSVLLTISMCFFILSEDQSVLSGFTIVSLAIAWCILPARKQVRSWLGLRSNNEFENAGVGGVFGAVNTAMALTRLGKKTAGLLSGVGGAAKSFSEAKGFDDKLAAITTDSAGMHRQTMQDMSEENGGLDGFSSASIDEQASMSDKTAGVSDEMSNEEKIRGRATSISQMRDEFKNKKADAEADIQAYDRSINASKLAIAHSESIKADNPGDKAVIDQENANIARERANIQQNETLKSGRQKDVRRLDDKIGRAEQSLKSLRAGYGDFVTNSPEDLEKQGYYEKMANADNFDLPEFNGKISTKRRAELQRQRALKQAVSHGVAAGGTLVGGATGALVGAGAMAFTGTSGMLMGAGIGMDAGMAAGGLAGKVAGGATGIATKADLKGLAAKIPLSQGAFKVEGGDGGTTTVRVDDKKDDTIHVQSNPQSQKEGIRAAAEKQFRAVQKAGNVRIDTQSGVRPPTVKAVKVNMPSSVTPKVDTSTPVQGVSAQAAPTRAQMVTTQYDERWQRAMLSIDDRGRNEYRDIIVGAQKEAVSTILANKANGQYRGLDRQERIRLISKEANDIYMDYAKSRMKDSKLVGMIEHDMPDNVTEDELNHCIESHIRRDTHKTDRFFRMLDSMGLYSEEG